MERAFAEGGLALRIRLARRNAGNRSGTDRPARRPGPGRHPPISPLLGGVLRRGRKPRPQGIPKIALGTRLSTHSKLDFFISNDSST